jgi:hypothetical protein
VELSVVERRHDAHLDHRALIAAVPVAGAGGCRGRRGEQQQDGRCREKRSHASGVGNAARRLESWIIDRWLALRGEAEILGPVRRAGTAVR